jgi:hypothetical protein
MASGSVTDPTHRSHPLRRMCCTLTLAWVIWSKFIPLGTTSDESKWQWQLITATTREAVCRQEASRLQGAESRYGVDGDRTYVCLPESIDPRSRR